MALEVHFHDSEFIVFGRTSRSGRTRRGSAGDRSGRGEHDETKVDVQDADAESGGSSKFGAMIALVVLIGLAFAVRRYRNGGTDVEIEGESPSVTESVET